MRIRLGLFVGFALGYYLGAMAGRERYIQMNRMIRRASNSDVAETATEKAKTVVDVATEKAKTTVSEKMHKNGTQAQSSSSSYSPSPS